MKITDKRESSYISFSEIKIGEIFINKDDKYYMKINNNGACSNDNAVDIETGNTCYFYDSNKCLSLMTELIIRN